MTQSCFFEHHYYKNPDIPLLFHLDYLHSTDYFRAHWHLGVEILYVIKGSLEITKESHSYVVNEQEIAVVNSNEIHMFRALTKGCEYYCLIADTLFCQQERIPSEALHYVPVIKDERFSELFLRLAKENNEKKAYFHSMMRCLTIEIYSLLSREYASDGNNTQEGQNKLRKKEAVKKAILYINTHFRESICLDQVCKEAGFSKYYFCHYFKDFTGQTVIDYINYIRCTFAQSCLASGNFNVAETAMRSGFQNTSYFTKVYKRYLGVLPSDVKSQK